MRNPAGSSSSSGASESSLRDKINNILNSLIQASQDPGLGDHPTAGRAFIETNLQEALKKETIQEIIMKLIPISAAVNARIGGWAVSRMFSFSDDDEIRKNFVTSINTAIDSLSNLEQEEKAAIEGSNSNNSHISDEKRELESNEQVVKLQAEVSEKAMEIRHRDEKIAEKDRKIQKNKEKRKEMQEELVSAKDAAQKISQGIMRLELELAQLKASNSGLSEKIKTAEQNVDIAKQEADSFKLKVQELSLAKEYTEKEITRVKEEFSSEKGNTALLTQQLHELDKAKADLEGQLREKEENSRKAEQKIQKTTADLDVLVREKESLTRQTASLVAEKTELEQQKESLEAEKTEIAEMLAQRDKEKAELEEKNRRLEAAAAEDAAIWKALTQLVLPEDSGAIVPFDKMQIVNSLIAKMQQHSQEQPSQKEKGKAAEIHPVPYTKYTETVLKDGKSIRVYSEKDMKAMLAYRKPILVFNVIIKLVEKLEQLKGGRVNKDNDSSTGSSNSSNSSSFISPPNKNIAIHNIKVILCYIFLYNAPMSFLIEQAIEDSRDYTRKNPSENKETNLKPWNILQIIDAEIPGLEDIQNTIQQEIKSLNKQDDYASYNDFVTLSIAQLPSQTDQNNQPLSARYSDNFHTFKWHQLAGLIKVFNSQNMIQIFGDLKLIKPFVQEMEAQLKSYQRNPTQSIMDVKMQEGKLCWVNESVLLPQAAR